jgi:hypothetical protein
MQLEVLEDRQLLATITVNTTADDSNPDTTLSLRQAIEVSDGTLAISSLSTQEQAQVSGAVGASNTIGFNIPTTDPGYNQATGAWTITVKSALPSISTNAAIINGYSQPGALENTLAEGDNAKLKIAIDGTVSGGNGLTIAQQGSQVFGLDIENFVDGVLITAGGSVQVAGCFIGTDPTGETPASNVTGVVLENSFNTIGGPNVGDRNVISGSANLGTFVNDGIYLPDQAGNPLNIEPTGNVIENNLIGLDAAGTKSIKNEYAGVEDRGSGNIYGGTAPGLGNVISGNGEVGVDSIGSITIEGNDIGTDATGHVALGNGQFGEGIMNEESAQATSISTTISNNVVSGNYGGMLIAGTPGSQSAYTIADNLIGTDAAGTAALGNKGFGLEFDDVDNATVTGNVIAAYEVGVRLETGAAITHLQNDIFQGNWIGTDKTGAIAMGNTLQGIEISTGSGITIGGTGPGQGNVIAYNGDYGIFLQQGQQDQFTQNSTFANAKAGIFVNYAMNKFIGPPTLVFTPGTASTGTLSGTLAGGAKNAAYVVEIYSSPSDPVAGQPQGATFVKEVTVQTDGTGQGTFSLTEPYAFYTATDTDPSGDTSGLSNATGTAGLPATVTTVSASANPSTLGQQVTFTAVVTTQGSQATPTGTVTFTIDGQAQAPAALSVVGGMDEAQLVTSTLTAGQHSVSATYSGDVNFSPSSGSLPTQTVSSPSLPATTTMLTSSLDPSTVGKTVTFTAVVAAPGFAGTPAGTVTFTIDGHAQTPVPLSVIRGVDEATFATSTLTAGQHSVTAAYSGDTNLSPSNGSLPTQIVNAANLHSTTTTIVSSLNPSKIGQQVTFTAVVSPGAVAGTPTGSVTFTIDGIPQTPVPLEVVKGSEHAVFSVATLTAGAHTISAAYDGNTTFAASAVARPLIQTVNATTSPVFDGPTVVALQRFGIHMQQTVLVLTFHDGLDPTSAQDLANYKIVDPSGRPISIASAVYDAAANTVTLRPRTRIDLHNTYHLTVIGKGARGVTNAQGTLLDGADRGQPGSNYTTTLNWRNVVLTPAELKKYVHPKQVKPSGALSHRFISRPR